VETVLEDLTMTYECLGRVSSIADAAHQTEFFRNQQVVPVKSYYYDAFGRLVRATGRETVEAGANTSRSVRQVLSSKYQALPFGQSTEVCNYVEAYTYDDQDNILSVQHQSLDASIGGWKRNYQYNEPSLLEPSKSSNRLSNIQIGDLKEQYSYDNDAGKTGCMTSMPGFSRLGWDCNNKLQSVARQKVNDGVPETTWYVYNEGGRRVRKVTDTAITEGSEPRKLKETIFLDSLEIYHTYQGDGLTPRSTTNTSSINSTANEEGPAVVNIEDLVLNADKSRTAAAPLFRYHVSTSLETDEKAQAISYEEYSPFGVSVLLACKSDIEAPRRYRFASYQRDNESGFYVCGARYYAPWLGRWTSPDPLGTVDGYNVYAYVRNDPVNWIDPDGTNGEEGGSGHYKERRNAITDWYGQYGDHKDTARMHLKAEKALRKQESVTTKVRTHLHDNKAIYPIKAATFGVGQGVGLLLPGIVSSPVKFVVNKVGSYGESKIKGPQKKNKMINRMADMASTVEQAAKQDVYNRIFAIGEMSGLSKDEKYDRIMKMVEKNSYLNTNSPQQGRGAVGRESDDDTLKGSNGNWHELEKPPRPGGTRSSAKTQERVDKDRNGARSTHTPLRSESYRAAMKNPYKF
jgi:RHS repeat-associated protein